MLKVYLMSNSLPQGVVHLDGVKDDLSNIGEVLASKQLLPTSTPEEPASPRFFEYNFERAKNKPAQTPKLKQIGLNFSGDDCIYI